MDIVEQMERNPKIYFWYVLKNVGKPGAMVNAQMAFDVKPTGTTAEGNQYLDRVIPETIRQLTVSDVEEYKIHRAARREAGYNYDDVLSFLSAKYPPPKIVSNADDPKFGLTGGGCVAGDGGAGAGDGGEPLPVIDVPAASLPGPRDDSGANP